MRISYWSSDVCSSDLAEIALLRFRRADADGAVGLEPVQRAGISLRIDRYGAIAERLRRADHSAGDLAAIGDQDGVEAHVFVMAGIEPAINGFPPGPTKRGEGRITSRHDALVDWKR